MAIQTRLLIGGELVDGAGPEIEVENPFTEEIFASVGSASREQLDDAVRAATAAKAEWASMPAVDRAPLLHGIATAMRQVSACPTWDGIRPHEV